MAVLLLLLLVAGVLPALEPPPPRPAEQPWSMHLAIAYSEGQAPGLARAFNKTLANLTRALHLDVGSPPSVTLAPLVVELPRQQRFGSALLEDVCRAFHGKWVVAVLVVGGSPAAFAVALAAETAGIPVLWARVGGEPASYLHQCEISGLEVRLEPGAREMLHAVRALLLAAHWHQFTALVDYSASSSVLLRRDLASIFSAAPLSPTIHAIDPLQAES